MTSIELRVKGIFSRLSNAEQAAASYFLNNVDSVFNLPIAKLAEQSGVTQVTWVRFCKALGFQGLKDLRKSLFAELNDPALDPSRAARRLFSDLSVGLSVAEMAETVRNSSIQAVEDTVQILNLEAVEQAVAKMLAADSIALFGVGASALVAEDLYEKLLRIGSHVRFSRDTHVQFTYAANLSERDAAIFLSNSGATREILECLELARQRGCTAIAVTQVSKNALEKGVDIVLSTSSPEVYLRSGAMSSRIAQLVVVDILYTALASQDYSRTEASLERSYKSVQPHKLKNP